MSHNNPPVRNAVIAALTQHGPMTCHEIADVMDWPLIRVQSVLRSARWLHPEKMFRVVGYKRTANGRGKDASVYALQAGADVPRNVVDFGKRRLQARALYRYRNQAAINARNRADRALKAGHAASANPWLHLTANAQVRSAITYLERTANAHNAKEQTSKQVNE